METKYLKINPADNVAVAIVALPAGEKLIVDGKEIVLNEDVPAGHKFALQDLAEGENVIKYGYPIGHARTAKKQGDWMNENNIKTNLAGLLEYTYNPTEVNLDMTEFAKVMDIFQILLYNGLRIKKLLLHIFTEEFSYDKF